MTANKQQFVSGASLDGLELKVGLEYHKIIDYDRKGMRKALTKGAGEVRKLARRKVSRAAIALSVGTFMGQMYTHMEWEGSKPGEYPRQRTGALMRAIGIVSRGSKGGWVKIGVKKTEEMKTYYPAFLFYGSKRTGLKSRGNYITDSLEEKRETVRGIIRDGLKNSLVPR